jgi:hypothetical protein
VQLSYGDYLLILAKAFAMFIYNRKRQTARGQPAGWQIYLEFPAKVDQREKAARRAVNKGQKKPDHLIK